MPDQKRIEYGDIHRGTLVRWRRAHARAHVPQNDAPKGRER
jgi:hypothetical protein